jgi:hypothetical protein
MDDINDLIQNLNTLSDGIPFVVDRSNCLHPNLITVSKQKGERKQIVIEFDMILPTWIFDSISSYEILDFHDEQYVTFSS